MAGSEAHRAGSGRASASRGGASRAGAPVDVAARDAASRRPHSTLEASARRREEGGRSVGELLRGFASKPENAQGLSLAAKVRRAWFSVNGDIERQHTCGLFVKESSRPGVDPLLVVYVDTRPRAVDFTANREIYVARMAMAGFRFSEMRFQVSKRPRGQAPGEADPTAASPDAAPAAAAGRKKELPLPELTAQEREQVASACANLPEGLRESVSRAMSQSYRRQRANRT